MKQTTFHRNLNAKETAWSYNEGNGAIQVSSLYAENVSIKQPSGKKFIACLNGTGNRAVFAWFRCLKVILDSVELPDNAQRVNFNPKNGDRFFHINGKRVDRLSRVWCLPNGQCYAIR